MNNPFERTPEFGHRVQVCDMYDRLEMVKGFGLDELRAVAGVVGVQKAVVQAAGRRIRKIEAAAARPFGWEVDVECAPGASQALRTYHWRGCSEGAARSKARLKPHVQRVVEVRPVSESEWIRAYGIGEKM